MKIIFFGTPEYVVPVLSALHKNFKNNQNESAVVGVVTQAPEPKGRERKVEFSPVDVFAHSHKIPIYFDCDALPEADLGVCAAYGKIIPQSVISRFPLGILNIHPSLLPEFRGASPTQAAIATGASETGVTIIKMDEFMDHGDIVSFFKSEIHIEDTNETLRKRLFAESVEFLLNLIPPYISQKIKLKKQIHEKATLTTLLKRTDGFIPSKYLEAAICGTTLDEEWKINFVKDYSTKPSPEAVERFVRAVSPWPGAHTNVELQMANDKSEKRLKILKAHIEDQKLILDEVQLEGKNPVSFEQFKGGYPEAKFA